MQIGIPTTFDIESSNYHHRVYLYSQNNVVFERQHRITKPTIEVDTFGSSWLLGIGFFKPHQLACHRYGRVIPLSGLHGFFIPPYGLVEWHLNPGQLHWLGFMAESELPAHFSKKSFSFSMNPEDIPKTHLEALSLIEKQHSLNIIEKEENDSQIALKVKNYIDTYFCEDIPICKMASQLEYNRVVMGRVFKSNFGLSPIEYRNRLRIFHSTKLLRQGLDVTTAAYQSGFGHISRFQDNFKNIMKVSPLEFCLQKKKSLNSSIIHGGIKKWKKFLSPAAPDLLALIPPML